jgi:dCTP deaminase
MTVLGKSDLISVIRKDELVVSPILSADQIGAASIDLRMGNVALMVRARGASHVDPSAAKAADSAAKGKASPTGRRPSLVPGAQQKHERYEIPFETRFLLHPGDLALVPTLEWLKLPSNLMGSVTARSTWAREGLSIATATLIEPNYEGIATLELANLGQIPIALYPGLRIAQIAFSRVVGSTARKRQQFKLSFEPRQGKIAENDEPFIPNY